jgi:hypothetical protein
VNYAILRVAVVYAESLPRHLSSHVTAQIRGKSSSSPRISLKNVRYRILSLRAACNDGMAKDFRGIPGGASCVYRMNPCREPQKAIYLHLVINQLFPLQTNVRKSPDPAGNYGDESTSRHVFRSNHYRASAVFPYIKF